jgi:predicted molibdopterin-dependent oxidoreductase YjgC
MPPDEDLLRTPGIRRGARFTLTFDGREITAHEGESVLGALWAAGIRTLHVTARTREPRGFYCGMGACFDCIVTIDGVPNLRACAEPARPGMRIAVQHDAGHYAPLPTRGDARN